MNKTVFDCATGEQLEVEMTAEEIAAWEASSAAALAEEEAAQSKAIELQATKQSANDKLAALGLTAEEIAAITGA